MCSHTFFQPKFGLLPQLPFTYTSIQRDSVPDDFEITSKYSVYKVLEWPLALL